MFSLSFQVTHKSDYGRKSLWFFWRVNMIRRLMFMRANLHVLESILPLVRASSYKASYLLSSEFTYVALASATLRRLCGPSPRC